MTRKGGAVTRSQTRRAREDPIDAHLPIRARTVGAPAAKLMRKGYSYRDASRIIAAAAFRSSPKAVRLNPALRRVKGFESRHVDYGFDE